MFWVGYNILNITTIPINHVVEKATEAINYGSKKSTLLQNVTNKPS